MKAWLFFFKYIHLNTFNLTWFMKTGYQHLLRRRDLSCTKVNAVNRLSNCLYASFRLSKRRLLVHQQPFCLHWKWCSVCSTRTFSSRTGWQNSWGKNQNTQLFKPLSSSGLAAQSVEEISNLSGSAIFLRHKREKEVLRLILNLACMYVPQTSIIF